MDLGGGLLSFPVCRRAARQLLLMLATQLIVFVAGQLTTAICRFQWVMENRGTTNEPMEARQQNDGHKALHESNQPSIPHESAGFIPDYTSQPGVIQSWFVSHLRDHRTDRATGSNWMKGPTNRSDFRDALVGTGCKDHSTYLGATPKLHEDNVKTDSVCVAEMLRHNGSSV